jgi:hypothetical protein
MSKLLSEGQDGLGFEYYSGQYRLVGSDGRLFSGVEAPGRHESGRQTPTPAKMSDLMSEGQFPPLDLLNNL